MKFSTKRIAMTILVGVSAVGVWAQDRRVDDPVLIKTDKIEVRKSDYEATLLLIPEEEQSKFLMSSDNVIKVLADLLRGKTLAAQAQASGLDKTPKATAMVKIDTIRIYAQLRRDQIAEEAQKAFEAKKATFEARAKEVYIVDKEKYQMPAEVKASHILFSDKKYDGDEGLKRAREVREQLLAGADFGEMVKKESDDNGAAENLGELGWFTADRMVPEFSKAAFALKKEGDISEPVRTQFGWHLIRLEGKKAAEPLPFEQVKPQIMEELEKEFIKKKRDEAMLAIDNDPSASLNKEEIDKLFAAPVDFKTLEKQFRDAQTAT